MKIREGKSAITISGYEMIAEKKNRLINKKWDIISKDNMMYSRAQTVLNCIHKLIPQSMPSDPVSISKLTLPEADSLFEVTFNHFWALSMTVPLT